MDQRREHDLRRPPEQGDRDGVEGAEAGGADGGWEQLDQQDHGAGEAAHLQDRDRDGDGGEGPGAGVGVEQPEQGHDQQAERQAREHDHGDAADAVGQVAGAERRQGAGDAHHHGAEQGQAGG